MFLNLFALFAAIFTLILTISAMVCIISRVPYVPTKKKIINKILEVANLKKGENIYDLGCGDGRLLFEAEKKYHTKGVGFELSPIPYLLAIFRKIFKSSKVKIYFKNFYKADLNKAKKIFLYLTPAILESLAPKLKKECCKGTQIISHTFHIEGLNPIKTIEKNITEKTPIIYIYQI